MLSSSFLNYMTKVKQFDLQVPSIYYSQQQVQSLFQKLSNVIFDLKIDEFNVHIVKLHNINELLKSVKMNLI